MNGMLDKFLCIGDTWRYSKPRIFFKQFWAKRNFWNVDTNSGIFQEIARILRFPNDKD